MGHKEMGEPLCQLHSVIDQAMASVESTFSSITLASLIQTAEAPLQPLCRRVPLGELTEANSTKNGNHTVLTNRPSKR
jgi:DNA-binding IscR family transcriptional regulator